MLNGQPTSETTEIMLVLRILNANKKLGNLVRWFTKI